MEHEHRGVDLRLLGWLVSTVGTMPQIPYDLRKVKRLEGCRYKGPFDTYTENIPDWLEAAEGDFSLIGSMPNLKVLDFSGKIDNGLISVRDFSFLTSCKKLTKLNVAKTDFKDCRLLLELPELKLVCLPEKGRMIHTEELSKLNAVIEFETGADFINASDFTGEIIDKAHLNHEEKDGIYAEYINITFRSLTNIPEDFAKYYVGRYPYVTLTGEVISDLTDRLSLEIKNGNIRSVCISVDDAVETNFMTVDIEQGWAAVLVLYNEEEYYHSYNSKYEGVNEAAPPLIGGQSPVPKKLAIDDLETAAGCIVHYINTGQLYPDIRWLKA